MAARIHPSAVIESGAKLGADVEIGAFAYVGAAAVVGDGCRLHHHAAIDGNTVLGRECELFPFACLGGKTQDLKYKGGTPGVRIGDRNVFREYVTVHAATNDGEFTTVGSDNTLLAYTHIAHDCVVGNHVIMSNYAGLAGHVTVDDHVLIAAYGGVHQFCRVGAHAMVGGCAKVVQDVPPYLIVDGEPATVRTFNKVGLERRGFTPEQLDRVKQIYRMLYREGLNRSQALEKMAAHRDAGTAEFQLVLDFAQRSQRGLAPGAAGA
ncbi:MAG: acyl-ACP--UDP-N-acetylglucosamine O-acyltransferase [Opitutae bacterium]|nr:acyl-ACP--UDP-N-acetylglucosamine O-acyltransferase [Opitutae bacterium]